MTTHKSSNTAIPLFVMEMILFCHTSHTDLLCITVFNSKSLNQVSLSIDFYFLAKFKSCNLSNILVHTFHSQTAKRHVEGRKLKRTAFMRPPPMIPVTLRSLPRRVTWRITASMRFPPRTQRAPPLTLAPLQVRTSTQLICLISFKWECKIMDYAVCVNKVYLCSS